VAVAWIFLPTTSQLKILVHAVDAPQLGMSCFASTRNPSYYFCQHDAFMALSTSFQETLLWSCACSFLSGLDPLVYYRICLELNIQIATSGDRIQPDLWSAKLWMAKSIEQSKADYDDFRHGLLKVVHTYAQRVCCLPEPKQAGRRRTFRKGKGQLEP
jgi:hypothetical protein